MKIGIIGAGHIGGTLARKLHDLGHDVEVANSRGPDTLVAVASETGAKPATVDEAAHGKDVVIVTIPEKSVRNLPTGLFAHGCDDTVVVDTGNYYPQRDGRIDEIESGEPESKWVADHLGRRVVKAFNNILFAHLRDLGRPKGDPQRIALPVAGDSHFDKEVVIKLVNELGFDAVDSGSLDDSWRQQPGSPVYLADLDVQGTKRALSEAHRERPPEFRAKT